MHSRQNGDFKRSVISALAAMVAAAVPSLVPSVALADKPANDKPAAAEGQKPEADKAEPKKAEPKKVKKSHAPKGQKPAAHAKADTKKAEAKPEEPQAKADTKPTSSAGKGKKAKKTASRSAGAKKKTAKKSDSEAPRRPCEATTVAIDRGGLEGQTLKLVDCKDKPFDASAEALSVLARPWGAAKPAALAAPGPKPGSLAAHVVGAKAEKAAHVKGAAPGEVAPGVKLLDKGLLKRLAAIAKRFPNRPISLVSGYRPQSRGSLHQAGRALDLRVAGVSNEELVAFCKTLPDTGCGYYPNSSFVHVDVRLPKTGTVSWIDASGPGEAPHYVKQWPPPPEEADTAVLAADDEPHDATTASPWQLDPDDAHVLHDDGDDAGFTHQH
jgi:hypothetical protein